MAKHLYPGAVRRRSRFDRGLGIAPNTVLGNSSEAIIVLDLLIRHPQLVRGAILHEPPMTSYISNPEEVLATLQQVIEGGMQSGGPRGEVEAFLRFAAGDEVFESLEL